MSCACVCVPPPSIFLLLLRRCRQLNFVSFFFPWDFSMFVYFRRLCLRPCVRACVCVCRARAYLAAVGAKRPQSFFLPGFEFKKVARTLVDADLCVVASPARARVRSSVRAGVCFQPFLRRDSHGDSPCAKDTLRKDNTCAFGTTLRT